MRFVVVGCGRWGTELAGTLHRGGHAVAVVDPDAGAFARLGAAFRGQTVVGDGLDRAALREAGAERADALAAVTGSDEVNVVLARAARERLGVPRVVARVHDPGLAAASRRLGLPTVSGTAWGVQRLADLLRYSRLEPEVSLGDGAVDVVAADVPALLAGRPVGELSLPGEVQVVALERAGRTFLPPPGATFRQGDRAHLAVLAGSLERLEALLGAAG
jgi:trk system potassium uptake protein TrkA